MENRFLRPNRLTNSILLETIIAYKSKVTIDDLWDASTNLATFQGLVHLTYIDLGSNDLQSLPSGLFPKLAKLLFLKLSDCNIATLETGVFDGLESLKNLYLDHNVIISLPRGIFSTSLGQLTLIYLNSNHLESLNEDLFVHTPNITNLDISQNVLSTFSHDTFKPIQLRLNVVDFSENPIECSCDIRWLVDWQKSSVHIAKKNDTICSLTSDVLFREKQVFTIKVDELCVSSVNLYYALPILALVLLCIVSVAYVKRRLFQYKLYLLKLAVLGYKEIHDPREHTDYDFDLNIIFTNEDKEWADYLRRRLEDGLPHFNRVVFGDEGLPFGMYYLDAVLHVIEHSFKTVLLLSMAATRDHEFMMKLRTALNHVTTTRTQCTLLIFVEEIPDDNLPQLVKLYLSEERPYICWDADETAQIYFWEKLVKSLKVNLRCNDMIPPE